MTSPSADPATLVRVAIALFQRNEFASAEACCRQALAAQPDSVDALAVLAVSLNAQERHAEASVAFDALTRCDPGVASHFMNLGTSLRAQRRFEEALEAYAHAAALGESSADFFYNVGLLHIDRGNFEAARVVLNDAVRFAPDDAEICCRYAQCCYETMHADDAIAVLEKWPAFRGLSTELVAQIALLLMNLGEPLVAERAMQYACRDPAPEPSALMRLIQVQERTNRLAEARDGLARLRRDPRSANLGLDMVLVEAQLAQREGRYEAACGLYRRLVDACVELHLRHHHLFPLAKCLDALQRHDEAFATLEEAHRSQVALLSLTAPDAVARRGPPMQITEFQCDPDDAARWEHSGAPSTAESPVFIVAFPRSGTTLLEQALDAHPMLQTMDEQPFLQNAVDDLIEQGVVYPEGLAAANEAQLAQARARYWALARRKVRLEPGQRLLDKNPLNLLRLPAMRRLFPNARIVLAIRHPCDVILSCFMQHFRAPEFALLCRDPVTLATGYRRAFDFWYLNLALLRPAVHEVRYESFVTDFAAQVRAVSEFLDLPWVEGMLAPAEHAQRKGFISTPSYAQVVQPVNGRAVGRWTAYRKHLSGVLPHVRPYLERWGYDG